MTCLDLGRARTRDRACATSRTRRVARGRSGRLRGRRVALVRAKPRWRATTCRLAHNRLTSHSHGPGTVSSKSLMSKTRLRSGLANFPKLVTCASPHACTRMPVTAVRREVHRHDRRRAPEERERRLGHPSVPDGPQLREPASRPALEDGDGIRPPGRRTPFGVRRPRHLAPERAPGVCALLAHPVSSCCTHGFFHSAATPYVPRP